MKTVPVRKNLKSAFTVRLVDRSDANFCPMTDKVFICVQLYRPRPNLLLWLRSKCFMSCYVMRTSTWPNMVNHFEDETVQIQSLNVRDMV